MEVEPLEITFNSNNDQIQKQEVIYIKNSDPHLKDMHVEFKLFDKNKFVLNP